MVELQTRKYRCRVVEAELPRLNYICGSVAGECHTRRYIRGVVAADLQRHKKRFGHTWAELFGSCRRKKVDANR